MTFSSTNVETSNLLGHGKRSLDDLLVKRQNKKQFWSRKWSLLDVTIVVSTIVVHLLALLAPFVFNWSAFGVFVGLQFICRLFGITLCYHRCLTHRSFKLPKWLEYVFAYLGVLSGQMDPIYWVSAHRYHHQHCDSERDPHSPNEGFWFSHITWLFDHEYMRDKCGDYSNVEDLKSQVFYRFLHKTNFFHPPIQAIPLYALGGLPFVVWGMGVRIVWQIHSASLVNSICHKWGSQVWNTGDLSKNNWLMGLIAHGEGWHNNHHAFENSARHGLEWWQIDMTWYAICFLEAVGLATDVKLPTNAQKQRKSF